MMKMKYRYYGEQGPIVPGLYPQKQGCVVCNYEKRTYIDMVGYAYGHIEYDEPLTDIEVNVYGLKPEYWGS